MYTINHLKKMKKNKKKFAALTVYDATFARLLYNQGINVMLVGDSLGMVIQGHNSTLSVTMNDIIYHVNCVKNGAPNCLLLADLPFMSYNNNEQALNNSVKLMKVGANIIKLEVINKQSLDIISYLTKYSIPICGHIGLTPQYVNYLGGYKIQGTYSNDANKLLDYAVFLEQAGVVILLLEYVPEFLAKKITETLKIPVIGIGAGVHTDGQILVLQDVLGITNNIPVFAKNYLDNHINIAISKYIKEVEFGTFPIKNN
ncbi:MAG: 3-methyl-2-oxobutanoate hydroxymethyltransferase [Candidatus Lightella neohaematopini]|nr:3-methyl-2-oxobutanoate hydroxymethyltransferase [Candidatus Lightella neohaematopini]